MTNLSTDQLEHIRHEVEESSDRYTFLTAAATDKDRKLVVVAVYDNNGELNTATVKTDKAPNWLSNTAQFEEVVDEAMKKLMRGGF